MIPKKKEGEGPGTGKDCSCIVGEYQDREVGRVDWRMGWGKRAYGTYGEGWTGKEKSFAMETKNVCVYIKYRSCTMWSVNFLVSFSNCIIEKRDLWTTICIWKWIYTPTVINLVMSVIRVSSLVLFYPVNKRWTSWLMSDFVL